MSQFYSRARTAVEAYINLVQSEGAVASKRVNATRHIAEHDIIFERGCRILSYAQGSDCDSTGTIAAAMHLEVMNSPSGTLGDSMGIVWAGDVVYVFDVSTETAWRLDSGSTTPPVNDNIVLTDAEIYHLGTAVLPIDYTTLTLANIDIVVVGREGAFKTAEDEVAWGTEDHANNAASVPMEDDCPVDTDFWVEDDNLEDDVLVKLATDINVLIDPATDTILPRIIGEDNLTLDALMSLKGNMHPDGCFQYFTGYAGYTKAYPLGIQPGSAPPAVSAPAAGGTFGNKNDWSVRFRNGDSVFSRAMTGGNITYLLNRFKGKKLRLVVVYKNTAGTEDLTMEIIDSAGSSPGTIDVSAAADYTVFYVDHDVNAAATDLYWQISNTGGSPAGSTGLIAFVGLFFMSKSGNYWTPLGDEYYEIINQSFSFSAVALNTFSDSDRQTNNGAGFDPCIEGVIVGVHTLATLQTAGGGDNDYSLYHCDAAGTEAEDATYKCRIASGARVGRAEWTPTWGTTGAPTAAPIMLAGGDYGSFICHKVNATAGGAPTGIRISDKIWVIKG
ncbi:MAG: hypothetical protein PHE17_19210 [Thiothrix sp.]|uniref:hypothetical protein n=1 Tax=Thiothrix sp. TaxID=1032 RepID=UPI0026371E84|nr:hypothetical protein [Thiothrix sp.]MDD5395156.1 hypothetical protein [Thiothrix sp.]